MHLRAFAAAVIAGTICGLSAAARAQDPGASVPSFDKKTGGSEKLHMLSHVTSRDGPWKAADVELEQDPSRPYVYLCGFVNFGVQVYDISNKASPKKVFSWTIENPELHRGIGAMEHRSCG